jgi:hypothetical protein
MCGDSFVFFFREWGACKRAGTSPALAAANPVLEGARPMGIKTLLLKETGTSVGSRFMGSAAKKYCLYLIIGTFARQRQGAFKIKAVETPGIVLANKLSRSRAPFRTRNCEMPHQLDDWAPRTTVKIIFSRDSEGRIDHLAPFVAAARGGRHSGIYEDEPHVIALMEPDTQIAFFEAQLNLGRWKFGHRAEDKDW